MLSSISTPLSILISFSLTSAVYLSISFLTALPLPMIISSLRCFSSLKSLRFASIISIGISCPQYGHVSALNTSDFTLSLSSISDCLSFSNKMTRFLYDSVSIFKFDNLRILSSFLSLMASFSLFKHDICISMSFFKDMKSALYDLLFSFSSNVFLFIRSNILSLSPSIGLMSSAFPNSVLSISSIDAFFSAIRPSISSNGVCIRPANSSSFDFIFTSISLIESSNLLRISFCCAETCSIVRPLATRSSIAE